MFYSKIFTVRKNHSNAARTVHSQARNRNQESITTCSYNLEFTMLILNYFKPKDGLPNSKGGLRPLSLSIPSQAIIPDCSSQSQSHRRRLLQTTRARNLAQTYCCCPYFLINVVASNTVLTLP